MAMGLAAAALIATLTACSNYGFFSTLESETSSAKTSSFKRVKINDIVYFNNRYYARAATVYSQSASTIEADDPAAWELLAPGLDYYKPTTAEATAKADYTYSCKAIASDGSRLYLASAREDNTTGAVSYGLYSMDAGGSWKTVSALSKDAVTGSFYGVQALYSLNGKVFAAVKTSESSSVNTYKLYLLSETSATEIAPLGSLYSLPVAAYMNDEYWFSALASSGAAYSTLYHSANADLTGMATVDTSKPASVVTVMTPLGTSGYGLFGMTNGSVYTQKLASLDTTWSTKTAVNSSYPVEALVALPYGSASPSLVLASVHYANGYYVSKVAGSALGTFYLQDNDSSSKDLATNYGTTLDSLLVGKFVYANDRLFACVSATATSVTTKFAGLYSNLFSSSTWSGWIVE
jgi:hypothetical protein